MKVTVLLENSTQNPILQTEHGLSLYIEACGHRLLFDMGQSSRFAANAAWLGVNLQGVDIAILSHGHYDHGGGLGHFLALNRQAPVYLSARAFEPHWYGPRWIGLDSSLAGHPRLVPVGDQLQLGDGLQLVSCNSCRAVCPVDSGGLTVQREGRMQPEDFCHEQYLVIQEGGQRVVVSGCSHKGIVNLVHWLQPDVLIGGFHLQKLEPAGPGRAALQAVASQLARSGAQYYTGHCTGQAAYGFLRGQLGERLQPLATGQTIII